MFVLIMNRSIAISNICSDEHGNCYNVKNKIQNKLFMYFEKGDIWFKLLRINSSWIE